MTRRVQRIIAAGASVSVLLCALSLEHLRDHLDRQTAAIGETVMESETSQDFATDRRDSAAPPIQETTLPSTLIASGQPLTTQTTIVQGTGYAYINELAELISIVSGLTRIVGTRMDDPHPGGDMDVDRTFVHKQTDAIYDSMSDSIDSINDSIDDTNDDLSTLTADVNDLAADLNALSASISSIAFVRGGNAFGTSATLGTTDTQPLSLITGGTPRLTITADGKVGIGTNAPEYPLDVVSNKFFQLRAQDNDAWLLLRRADTSIADGNVISGIMFAGDDASVPNTVGALIQARATTDWTGANFATALDFKTTTNNATPATTLTLRDGNLIQMIPSGGYVTVGGYLGIGISDPNHRLTIAASSTSVTDGQQIGLRSARAAIVSGNLLGGISFDSNDTNLTTPGITTASILALANETHTASALGTDLVFSTTNGTTTAERLRILGNGNIGVGTPVPNAPFHIVGSNTNSRTLVLQDNSGNRAGIDFQDDTGTTTWAIDAQDTSFRIGEDSTALANIRFNINPGGNVGIGTTNPTGLLSLSLDGGSGSVTNQYGMYVNRSTAAAQTATNVYGVYVNNLDYASGKTTTNAYGLYIGSMFASGLNYGLYQADSSDRNYFAGNVSIGTTTSTEKFFVSGPIVAAGTRIGHAANQATLAYAGGAAQLWSHGADTATAGEFQFLQRSSNGSVARTPLVIDASGNVGLGVTTPTYRLQVAPASQYTALNVGDGFAVYNPALTSANVIIGVNSGSSNIIQSRAGTASNNLSINPFGGSVGIGTASPGAQLDIMNANGGTLRLSRNDTTLTNETLGTLEFYSNDTDDTSVRASIGALKDNTAVARAPTALTFSTGDNTPGSLVERMRISSDGNIGIGTTSPVSKLDLWDGGISLSDPDVTTGYTNTNVYGDISIKHSTAGGLKLRGFSDAGSINGITIDGVIGSNTPTADVPAILLRGFKKDAIGTSFTSVGDSETLFGISNGSGSSLLNVMGNGNVGIGTTGPQARLDIVGDGSGNANNTTTGASFGSGRVSSNQSLVVRHKSDAGISGINFPVQLIQNSSQANAFEIYSTGATPLVLGTNATERLRINTNGDVSVGTSTTYANFSVNATRSTIDRHAFEDWSILNTSDTGVGYSSFDAKSTLTNSLAENHFVAYQARNIFNGTGNLTDRFVGFHSFPVSNGSGTIANVYGVKIDDIGGTGGVTNNYGLYISSMARGSSSNFALYSAGGVNYFGGNVGIGTTTPSKALVVSSAVTGPEIIVDGGSNARGSSIQFNQNGAAVGNIGVSAELETDTSSDLALWGTAGAGLRFYTNNSATERMVINTSGNVGIGTSTPGAKLDVWGQIRASATAAGNNAAFSAYQPGVAEWSFGQRGSTQSFVINDGGNLAGTDALTILRSGNIGIGTTTPGVYKLVVDGLTGSTNGQVLFSGTNPSLRFWDTDASTNSGTFQIAGGGDIFKFRSVNDSGSVRTDNILVLTPGGNVGIGTTTPSSKLSVAGDTYIDGNLTATGSITFGNFNMNAVATCGQQYHTFIGAIGDVGGDQCAALNVTQQDTNGNVIYRFGGAGQTWAGEFYANSTLVGMNTKGGIPLSFQIGQSEKMRITATGNIGIGTSTPGAKLDVWGNVNVATGTLPTFLADTSTGRVGIGTSNPTSKLSVAGDISLTGDLRASNSFVIYGNNNAAMGFIASGSTFFAGSFTGSNGTGSTFLGDHAGNGTAVSYSNFFGYYAGYSAGSASYSNFLGYQAGYNAASAARSIFLGYQAGYGDTVNNTGNVASSSIAIGNYSGTGGFSNSIALGQGVKNSAVGQLNIGNVLYATGLYRGTTQSATPMVGGMVGIGTSTPSEMLTVAGSARFTGVASGPYAYDLNLTADGTLTTSASDRRLKTQEELLDTANTLEKLLALQPKSFVWRETNTKDIGLIAQEVEDVFPEIVFTNPNDGYMGINYSRLPALIIAGVQELAAKVTELFVRDEEQEGKIDRLEQQNDALNARVQALEAALNVETESEPEPDPEPQGGAENETTDPAEPPSDATGTPDDPQLPPPEDPAPTTPDPDPVPADITPDPDPVEPASDPLSDPAEPPADADPSA